MSFLYFVLMGPDCIKIGRSNDVPKRLVGHRNGAKSYGNGSEVLLLAVLVGGEYEKDVQRYFVDGAIQAKFPKGRGQEPEYFHATLRLTNYIRWLRDRYYVAVIEDGIGEIIGEAHTFEEWSPNLQREVSPTFGLLTSSNLDFPERTVEPDDYYTNRKVIGCVRRSMEGIDLDPASHPEANRWVKASEFFTIHSNGLSRDWYGKVYVCPTFVNWGAWAPKVVLEWRSGRVDEMCLLCSVRQITCKYWKPIHEITNAMCVIYGRRPSEGRGRNRDPRYGHCVYYLGARPDRFVRFFKGLGSCYSLM